MACLRLGYFKEWEWGADIRRAYPAVAGFARAYCVADVPAYWLYSGSLSFYSVLNGRDPTGLFSVVTKPEEMPSGRAVYVLHREFNRNFINEQKLKIVYRGESTDVVVAIREEALKTQPCDRVDRPF